MAFVIALNVRITFFWLEKLVRLYFGLVSSSEFTDKTGSPAPAKTVISANILPLVLYSLINLRRQEPSHFLQVS